MADLKTRILEDIALTGPMPLSRYMNLCLGDPVSGYYMTRDPFGHGGDFTTAPEVSQMFGELVGAWLVAAWQALGRPSRTRLAELGPGRGTLMADCLRSLALEPDLMRGLEIDMVDMSPTLIAAQQEKLSKVPCPVRWHGTLPDSDLPTLLIANEFFDALPVHILVKTEKGIAERHITASQEGKLGFADLPTKLQISQGQIDAIPTGTVFELSPERCDVAKNIAAGIKANGGAALLIDYGYVQPKTGATFQALTNHQMVDPLDQPGEADLTALVDFTSLEKCFKSMDIHVSEPVSQMDFLLNLGLLERAGQLGSGQSQEMQTGLQQAVTRLVSPDEMGTLFKVLAAASFDDPMPGFQKSS
ncbi:class I SAM-dependent methyltransferase [Pararhizobium sp. IMCC21322]|uniref:class I SAM-dependent methyltransferase n=1 Tax=Pararhizobium sp. IMCC21322 TaxID=3067903 RepID=UPI0027406A34|nr:SAM-dependent methyltransferase [Pararhizobium sp. IMCC21322]